MRKAPFDALSVSFADSSPRGGAEFSAAQKSILSCLSRWEMCHGVSRKVEGFQRA